MSLVLSFVGAQRWPCSGPITSMFWRYLLACGVPFPAKIRMVAYLCTYISMAFAFYGIVGYLAVSLSAFGVMFLFCFFFEWEGERLPAAGCLAAFEEF